MTFTFGKYPEVWNDDELSVGANMILNGWDDRRQTKWIIAQAVLILDCYDGKGDYDNARNVSAMKCYRSLPLAPENET
jgi:hypothetical protein